MIVEEKDALDIPDHIAEEVIIDEGNDNDDEIHSNGNSTDNENPFKHYAEVECISPSQFNHHQNELIESESSSFKEKPKESNSSVHSKGHDNNNGNNQKNHIETIESDAGAATTQHFTSTLTACTTITTAATTDESEPIYLSDSLSCFDSDSDTQQEDLDLAIAQHKVETRRTADDRPEVPSDRHSNAIDEMDTLNISTDDVILVQPDYVEPIDVDQSDSDDERFASKYAFEPFVESDSQPTSSDAISKRGDVEHTGDGNKGMATATATGTAAATITATSSIDDTTSDADDDSSEVDRRGTRSRRDNVVRKNYSIRRTYARRKLKSDTESPVSPNELNHETKNEHCSDDNEPKNSESPELHGHQADNRVNNCSNENDIQIKSTQNTETGTDEECNSSNVMVTKPSLRTYVRKKGAISKEASCNSNSTPVTEHTLDTQNENAARSGGSGSGNSSSSSSSDAKAKSTVTNATMNALPRKRGRPRKNPVVIENSALDNDELKLCETTDEKVVTSSSGRTSLPLADTEIKIHIEEINGPAEDVEQVSNIAFQESNEQLRAEAITNDSGPVQTAFEMDRECQVICMDEVNSEVSSTELTSTASVQKSQKTDQTPMEIMGETNDQIDQGNEASKKNDQTQIHAMDTDQHCSESKPSISKLFIFLIFMRKKRDSKIV